MNMRAPLTTGALCAALGMFGGAVFARPAGTKEDAAIITDQGG